MSEQSFYEPDSEREPIASLSEDELISLLTSAREEEQEDSLRGRLNAHHRIYPANKRAAVAPSPDLEAMSPRVRINRACAQLQELGLQVSNPASNAHKREAEIWLETRYTRYGRVREFHLRVNPERIEDQDFLLPMAQEALLAQGLRPLVTMKREVLLLHPGPESDEALADWMAARLDLSLRDLMSLEEAERWTEQVGARTARDFFQNGLSLEEALHWLEIRVDDGGTALAWKKAGFSPEQVKEYISIHHTFRNYSLVKALADEGFGIEWLRAWCPLLNNAYDFSRVAYHQALRKEGWSLAHGESFRELGLSSYTFSSLRRDIQRAPESARAQMLEWAAVHPEAVRCAEEHEREGRDAAQVKRWREVHPQLYTPGLIREWERDGLGLSEAARWAQHAGNEKWAQLWRREVARAWEEAGEWGGEPERVGVLARSGLSPEQVQLALRVCEEKA